MKQQANPADYIPRARSKTTYDEFRERHPWLLRWEGLKLAISEWWCELWAKGLPESDCWERYKELHAGLGILWNARAHQLAVRSFERPPDLILDKVDEIEREIEEVKR
jgi:hypothetical protein